MQIVFKICKQYSLSTNLQPNSKKSGYFHEGSVDVISKISINSMSTQTFKLIAVS